MTIEDIKVMVSFLEELHLSDEVKKVYDKLTAIIEINKLEEELREKNKKLQELSNVNEEK